MALNCKAGDLAVVVSPNHKENIGKLVTVLEPIGILPEGGVQFIGPDGRLKIAASPGFYWWVEAQGQLLNNNGLTKRLHTLDASIRPIRDPGDDAQDETLLWKPVPASNPKTPEPV